MTAPRRAWLRWTMMLVTVASLTLFAIGLRLFDSPVAVVILGLVVVVGIVIGVRDSSDPVWWGCGPDGDGDDGDD